MKSTKLIKGKWYLLEDNYIIRFSHLDSNERPQCDKYITSSKSFNSSGGYFSSKVIREAILSDFSEEHFDKISGEVENAEPRYEVY